MVKMEYFSFLANFVIVLDKFSDSFKLLNSCLLLFIRPWYVCMGLDCISEISVLDVIVHEY